MKMKCNGRNAHVLGVCKGWLPCTDETSLGGVKMEKIKMEFVRTFDGINYTMVSMHPISSSEHVSISIFNTEEEAIAFKKDTDGILEKGEKQYFDWLYKKPTILFSGSESTRMDIDKTINFIKNIKSKKFKTISVDSSPFVKNLEVKILKLNHVTEIHTDLSYEEHKLHYDCLIELPSGMKTTARTNWLELIS